MKLLEGEKLILKAKPKKALKSYWVLKNMLRWFPVILVIGTYLSFIFSITVYFDLTTILFIYVIGIFLLMITIFFFSSIYFNLRFNKLHYWITNKRIILRKGLIGNVERSILLERLGEVDILQTWLQGVFGIHIVILEVVGKRRKTTIPAIPNAEEIKQTLLKLISEKRKAEKLTY